ncbi:MAG: hypothetical protein ACYS9X_11025, partial [Planctomycetota bacterium]
GAVAVWDASTGRLLAWLAPNDLRAFAVAAAVDPDGDRLLFARKASGGWEVCIWRRRRPEWWWGVLCLPHLWLIVALAAAVVWSGWRDLRRLRRMS